MVMDPPRHHLSLLVKTKEVAAIYIYGGTFNSLKTERTRYLTVPK
jgi:hypothetical protein